MFLTATQSGVLWFIFWWRLPHPVVDVLYGSLMGAQTDAKATTLTATNKLGIVQTNSREISTSYFVGTVFTCADFENAPSTTDFFRFWERSNTLICELTASEIFRRHAA